MQGDVVILSASFSRCLISDENFGLYNMTDGKLTASLDLKLSLDCRRTIQNQQLRAIEPVFLYVLQTLS